MKWVLRSHGLALFGSGLVFPFYIAFIREVGANFAQFGMAYGLFALSSAVVHKFIGMRSDRLGRRRLFLLNSWGLAVIFLLFPMVVSIGQLYVLQVLMGVLGAVQKTCEKVLVTDVTDETARGRQIGTYQGWAPAFSGLAVIAAGYIIDFLTLEAIFYIGSIFLFISGFFLLRMGEDDRRKDAAPALA